MCDVDSRRGLGILWVEEGSPWLHMHSDNFNPERVFRMRSSGPVIAELGLSFIGSARGPCGDMYHVVSANVIFLPALLGEENERLP